MLWKQITADVLNLPLEQIADHPGSSLGAAFIAGKGVGIFREWDDIEHFIEISATVEPDPATYARYETSFSLYRELYQRNRALFEKLR
jgi:xylulokinase